MRGAVTPYYVQYYLGREDLISAFLTAGFVAALLGALLTNLLADRYPKIRFLQVGALGIMVCKLALFITPPEHIAMAFFWYSLAHVCQMIVVPLMFSMVADTSDYGETLTGRNAMAMAYSVHLLAIKLGLALGAAFTGWILAWSGYVANEAQTAQALTGILWCFSLIPAVVCLAIALLMFWYRLDEARLDVIHSAKGQHVKEVFA
jgi:GPH family glycoside/pentoside/hexuronide:cation symporter